MYAKYYKRLFCRAWQMTKAPAGIPGFAGAILGILTTIFTIALLVYFDKIQIAIDNFYSYVAFVIVFLALVVSFFIINCFRAAPQLYSDQQRKIDSFTEQLSNKQNKLYIRDKLSEFMIEGKKLMNLCDDETKPPPNDEVTLWEDNIIKFLRENLENSFIARFRNPAGIPMETSSISSIQHRELWNGIRFRLARLDQFIEEYRD